MNENYDCKDIQFIVYLSSLLLLPSFLKARTVYNQEKICSAAENMKIVHNYMLSTTPANYCDIRNGTT